MSTFRNNLYVLKLILRISPSRLFFSIIITLFRCFSTVFFNAVVIRKIINGIQQNVDSTSIVRLILFILIYQIILSVLEGLYTEIYIPFSNNKIHESLRLMVYKKATEVDLECFENSDFYDNYVRASSQVDVIFNKVITSICDVITCFVTFFSMSYVMFTIDLGVLVFAIIPCIATMLFGSKLNTVKYEFFKEKQNISRRSGYVRRTFYLKDYAKEIKMYNIDKVLKNIFANSLTEMKTLIKRKGKIIGLLEFVLISSNDVLSYFGAIIYTTYKTILLKTMLYGDCIFIINSITSVSLSLRGVIELLLNFQNNALYIENLRFFLEFKPKIQNDDGCIPNHLTDLVLQNVSFKYKGTEKNNLEDINLQIRAGERIAIVGSNGSGKTTLIKLLLRLYDPTSGNIFFNGKKISEYSLLKYRRLFATVFQDYRMYSINIAENIIMDEYSKNNVESKIRQSLECVDLLEKVDKLSLKELSTITREFDKDGVIFSGGEYQKLAIARIFASESEILILDEPTSSLDPISEEKILNRLIHENPNKTLIFISHRLSLAKLVDKIYLMKNGRIIESGTHNDLISQKGEYADMWVKQSKNYKKEIYESL